MRALVLLKPGTVEVTTTQVDDETQELTITKKPFVTEVADRVLRREPMAAVLLKAAGYRNVERRLDLAAYIMARPPQLAWLLRRRAALAWRLWGCLWWLNDHGLLHSNTPDGVVFRWRDLRPGRGR